MKKKTILIHGIPEKTFYDGLVSRKDIKKIFVTEFRPLLWGARVVCKELLKRKLKPILICDNMAGFCLEKKLLDELHIFAKSKSKAEASCFIGSLVYAICAKNNKAKVILHPAAKVKGKLKAKDLFSFCGKRVAAKGIEAFVSLWEDVPLGLIKVI